MSDVPAEVHTDLTPKEIVLRLDQYIIGQEKAKRAVAVALRNRYRRLKLPEDIRDEVAPKNILMIGPTGVGKTEIARRLAKLCSAPFLKVEATKYTEVGYVGRDVESMIRDLTAVGFNDVKAEMEERLREKSVPLVEDRLLDLLLPGSAEKDRAAKANEKKRCGCPRKYLYVYKRKRSGRRFGKRCCTECVIGKPRLARCRVGKIRFIRCGIGSGRLIRSSSAE